MKTLQLVIFASFLFLGTSVFGQNIINSNEVNVTINSETTREQLFQIRNELLTVGMDFLYTPQFDQNRKLVSLSYSVRSTTGNQTLVEVATPVSAAVGAQIWLTKQGDTWKKK
ncbi:MAG: DUF3316 domain-containing protein [Bacteroidetes bacterium]|nr:DUF3316 domain-containing protein [Bacteroidota bacterium]